MRGIKATIATLVAAPLVLVAVLAGPAQASSTDQKGYNDPVTKILDTITSGLAENPVAQVVDQIVAGTVGRTL